MMSDFFIVLPSNVICQEYPDNKTSHYFTKLPKVLHLKGTWEVALTEIHYPHTWYNIPTDIACITLVKYDQPRAGRRSRPFCLPGGYYTPLEICKEINYHIKRTMRNYKGRLSFNERNRKMAISLDPCEKVILHEKFAKALGFIRFSTFDNTVGLVKLKVIAEHAVDLSLSVHNIFVYSNIVKDTLVGDTYTNLLRIVSVESKPGSHISKVFTHPYYHELNTNTLNVIEISTRDFEGNLIRYESGSVIIKLHFRAKKNSLLL
jgi:hypothetical protein